MSSKLVGFIGNPGSGKTTLACALKEYFMLKNISTDVCTEYAREFVFEYGFPDHPSEQYRLGLKQKMREDLLCKGKNEYVFTDSPIWLSYVYCLTTIAKSGSWKDQSVIVDIYKEFVISNINRYHRVYYVKNYTPFDDGCKRDKSFETTITNILDGFISSHKHILPIAVIDIPIGKTEDRKEFVFNDLFTRNF